MSGSHQGSSLTKGGFLGHGYAAHNDNDAEAKMACHGFIHEQRQAFCEWPHPESQEIYVYVPASGVPLETGDGCAPPPSNPLSKSAMVDTSRQWGV